MDGLDKCGRCGRMMEVASGRHLFGAECKPLSAAEVEARRKERARRDAELLQTIEGTAGEAPEVWNGLIDGLTSGRGRHA